MPDQIEVKDYIFKNNLHIILHILNLCTCSLNLSLLSNNIMKMCLSLTIKKIKKKSLYNF